MLEDIQERRISAIEFVEPVDEEADRYSRWVLP